MRCNVLSTPDPHLPPYQYLRVFRLQVYWLLPPVSLLRLKFLVQYPFSSRQFTMQALKFEKTGSLDGLSLVNVDKPTLHPGEALVRVRAAGINGVSLSYHTGTVS
jgi:hypothetical protein